MITGNLTDKNSLLSDLPMNFIRSSNEKRPFLSDLPMKNRGYITVYHKYTIQHRRVRLTLPRRAAALQRIVIYPTGYFRGLRPGAGGGRYTGRKEHEKRSH